MHFVLSLLHSFTHAHYLLIAGFLSPLFLFGAIALLIDPEQENSESGVVIFSIAFLVSLMAVTFFSYRRLNYEGFHLHAPTGLASIEMVVLAIFWICVLTMYSKSVQKDKQIKGMLEKVHYQELTPSFSSKDSASFFLDHCTLRVERIQLGLNLEISYKENSICSFSYVNGSVTDDISYFPIKNYIKKHSFFFSSLEKKMWKFDFSFPTTALTTALNELSSYVAQLDRSKLTLDERLFFQQAFEEELPLIHQTFLLEHEEEVKEVLSFLTEKVKTRVQEQKQTEKESQDSTLQQSIHRIYKKGQEFMK